MHGFFHTLVCRKKLCGPPANINIISWFSCPIKVTNFSLTKSWLLFRTCFSRFRSKQFSYSSPMHLSILLKQSITMNGIYFFLMSFRVFRCSPIFSIIIHTRSFWPRRDHSSLVKRKSAKNPSLGKNLRHKNPALVKDRQIQ